MFKKIMIHLYSNTTLKAKIRFLFIPLLLLAILSLGKITNNIYNIYIYELAEKHLYQKAHMLQKDINFRLEFFGKMSDDIYLNQNLCDTLMYYKEKNKPRTEVYNDYRDEINRLFVLYYLRNKYITRIYLYDSYLPSDGKYIMQMDKFPVKTIKENIESGIVRISIFSAETRMDDSINECMIMSRLFRPKDNILFGIISVEIDLHYFTEALRTFDAGENGWYIFRNDDGEIITSSEKIESLPDFKNLHNKDEGLFYSFECIHDTYLDVYYSEDLIREMGARQQRVLYIITGLFLLAAIAITAAFSKLAVNRIYLFIKKMKNINDYRDFKIDGNDEIALIDDNFNNMLDMLEENVAKEHRMEIEKKAIEIQLLQAQFNPHFLYNTLSAIRWSVLKKGDIESGNVLDKLILFYRAALSRGNHIVKISREIEIVEHYCEIQKYTYSRNYRVDFNVDDNVKDLYILKFILQPIVENAVLHGIYEKGDNGKILISAQRKDNTVYLKVVDNGSGISQKTLNKLNNALTASVNNGKSGYGIYNVIQRIKLFYGDEYGICFESTEGLGTKVEVSIPACTSEEI